MIYLQSEQFLAIFYKVSQIFFFVEIFDDVCKSLFCRFCRFLKNIICKLWFVYFSERFIILLKFSLYLQLWTLASYTFLDVYYTEMRGK